MGNLVKLLNLVYKREFCDKRRPIEVNQRRLLVFTAYLSNAVFSGKSGFGLRVALKPSSLRMCAEGYCGWALCSMLIK